MFYVKIMIDTRDALQLRERQKKHLHLEFGHPVYSWSFEHVSTLVSEQSIKQLWEYIWLRRYTCRWTSFLCP